jgi:hypothetical protein
MKRDPRHDDTAGPRRHGRACLLSVMLLLAPLARAQSPEAPPSPAPPAEAEKEPPHRVEVYGFAMLDIGYDFGQNDPAWFDVMRPTKLPAFDDEFGEDGRYYAGVRQSRLGVRGYLPTDLGELKTIFEFELFGVGVDAGQTTFRLRHAWGELGMLGAGQTWSPFMDPDVFPNSVEYWGPSGMVFFRNVQLRLTPWQKGDSRIAIAIERPGASADLADYAARLELEDVQPRFPAPDVSAHVRLAGGLGHVQLAGIVRYIEWDDLTDGPTDLSGDEVGWGVNLSGNLKLAKHVIRLQAVYGEAISNYMNDATVDIAAVNQPGNVRTPITGEALPLLGLVGFIDLSLSKHLTSTLGYSLVDIDNGEDQPDEAFSRGHYALANLMISPVASLMFGPEVQFGRRENFRDGFEIDDWRVQFSAKYSFKNSFGGTP